MCVCVCVCVSVCVCVCVFLIEKENSSWCSVAEETSGLHKRELLNYHEYFPILVFEGSLSIEISL